MIDLHSHTTASDGQHAPAELVTLAVRAGVHTLAVTDHDTVDGLAEAQQAADQAGLTLVPGIELSAFVQKREVHILGHFITPDLPALRDLSGMLRVERTARMERMVERLQRLGYPVQLEDVYRIAGEAQLGRPHLARAMVERGWCTSVREAFDRFLGDGKAAWVDRYRLEAAQAIGLIHEAGGTATLAHPGASRMERYDIEQLAAVGLDGLEVFHTDHNPSVREKYLKVARALTLVPTAGSDFHGEQVSPTHRLGSISTPQEAFTALRARARLPA
jgi:predicted metal-dependent phosphoesterase TrpH